MDIGYSASLAPNWIPKIIPEWPKQTVRAKAEGGMAGELQVLMGWQIFNKQCKNKAPGTVILDVCVVFPKVTTCTKTRGQMKHQVWKLPYLLFLVDG